MPIDTKQDYDQVALFTHPVQGGTLVGTITARKFGSLTRYSFSILREFEKRDSGEKMRIHWFDARHIGEIREMLDQIEARVTEEEKTGKFPKAR